VTEHVHDCVVVGAGPAGSAAALQLARDGLDVVFLERGDRPGEKNVMGGVLYKSCTHSYRTFAIGPLWSAVLPRSVTGS
jgi:flavin-dependent dehydrogenase